jgi:hypothetical protein
MVRLAKALDVKIDTVRTVHEVARAACLERMGGATGRLRNPGLQSATSAQLRTSHLSGRRPGQRPG